MKCKKCGENISSDSIYCANCGAKSNSILVSIWYGMAEYQPLTFLLLFALIDVLATVKGTTAVGITLVAFVIAFFVVAVNGGELANQRKKTEGVEKFMRAKKTWGIWKIIIVPQIILIAILFG